MGAEPWSYFVPYRDDVEAALFALQEQEFAAGRYRVPDPDDPPATIDEARAQCDADGTGTVLDMIGATDTFGGLDSDNPSFGFVAPLTPEQLHALYGTERPTHAMVEANNEFFEWIDRGLGIYIVVYQGDTPTEYFFAGYSFD